MKSSRINIITKQKAARVLLYKTLIKQVKNKISSGLYKEGDKIPTERQLCETYNISRATVRRALVELEKEKIIISRQGSGIYVSPHLFQQSLQKFYSFSKEMRKLGKTPSNKILSCKHITGSVSICEKMNVKAGTSLIHVVRLRLADNVPYMYETTYLPSKYMPDISKEQFETQDLYTLLQKDYNIVLVKAYEEFYPTLTNNLIASYLGIVQTLPCMNITRTTHSLNTIIEYTESIVRGDKFKYKVELNNE